MDHVMWLKHVAETWISACGVVTKLSTLKDVGARSREQVRKLQLTQPLS